MEKGERVPYRILYAAKNGDLITPQEGEVVTTSVDNLNGTRKVMFLNSGATRTLRDCLFMAVLIKGTEFKIVAN